MITRPGGTPTVTSPAVSTSSSSPPASSTSVAMPFGLTTGWFVFFGVGAGVLLSNTKVAPIILAILSSALLYQIGQLVEGK